MPKRDATTWVKVTTFRLTQLELAELDYVAQTLSKAGRVKISRTDALRLAIAKVAAELRSEGAKRKTEKSPSGG